MARIQVRWADKHDLRSYPEIAEQPGYYLDVLTGDIFRNAGRPSDASARILDAHPESAALSRKAFLLVTPSIAPSIQEVKRMIAEKFGVQSAELGKLVHSLDR